VLLTSLAVARFARAHAGAFYDDAYIYLRYVQNVFGGCPLAFNCADGRIEGFTSPLYLALLTLGGALGASLETVAHVVCAGSLALALGVAASLPVHPLFRRSLGAARFAVAAAVALVLAWDHYVVLEGAVGLDAGLSAAVVGAVGWAALDEKRRGLRALLIVGIVTRPELALLWLALPILPEGRKLRFYAPLAVAAAALALVRWGLFADVLPNTVWAKTGGTVGHFELGLAYLGETFRDFPLIALSPLALGLPRARNAVSYLLAASGLWLASFLYSGGDVFRYSRLAFPLVPLLSALALLGVAWWARVLLERAAPRFVRLSSVAAALVALGFGSHALFEHQIGDDVEMTNIDRWKKVGLFLSGFPEGTSVATSAIGAVSFYSHLRVIDLLGLTNREVGKQGATVPKLEARKSIGHERHNTEWVLAQKPDVIMTLAWSRTPFQPSTPIDAGVYADFLLMEEIRRGRAPYLVFTPEVAPGLYWFFFVRRDFAATLR
jgi:arabinofuranosyltransferase